MKRDELYDQLVKKMHEVAVVPPQTVGPLTPLYKLIVPQLKWQPWRSVAILSALASFMLYLVFGSHVVKLVSVLQRGF